MLCKVADQGVLIVMFGCQRDIADSSLRRLLIFLKLRHAWKCNCLRRLCPPVLSINKGPFQMNPQNFRSGGILLHHLCHIGHCFFQHPRHLRHRRCQKGGATVLRNSPCPVLQTLFFGIVGIKAVSPVCMQIDHPGDDSKKTVISVTGLLVIGRNPYDLPLSPLNLCRYELPVQPDSFAADNQFFSFSLRKNVPFERDSPAKRLSGKKTFQPNLPSLRTFSLHERRARRNSSPSSFLFPFLQ